MDKALGEPSPGGPATANVFDLFKASQIKPPHASPQCRWAPITGSLFHQNLRSVRVAPQIMGVGGAFTSAL
jgi:hypothetical protein